MRVEYQPFTAATSGYAARGDQRVGHRSCDAVRRGRRCASSQELYDEQPAAGQQSPRAFDRPGAVRPASRTPGSSQRLGTPDTDFLRDSLEAARAARSARLPVVLVDGRPLTAATPVALADALQRRLLATGD